jgi:type IV pilus assembly protein PilM
MAKYGVGIDIGSQGVTVAQLEKRGDALVLTGALRLSRPPGASETGLEPETAADLAHNLKSSGIPATGALLGLSGRDLILRYTQVPHVPDWRLKMLMEFEISELAGKSGGEVASDYCVLDVPEDAGGNRTAVVGLAKVDGLDARLGALTSAKIPAPDACPASIGLFHAVLASGVANPDETLMVLDIGAANTELVILQGGVLLFARNLSNGGDQFTQAVADAIGEPFEEAQGVKHKEGDVTPMRAMRAKNARAETVLSALAGAASQYAAMLQSSIMFAKAQTRMQELQPDRVLISGGGSRLRGMAKFLEGSLNVPVENFDPLSGISVEIGDPELDEAIGKMGRELAVAIGLARASAGEPGPKLNLLPPRVLRKREFFQQKLFVYGAVGLTLIAFIIALISSSSALASAKERAKRVGGLHDEAQRVAGEIQEVEADIMAHDAIRQAVARELDPGQRFVRLLSALQANAASTLFIDKISLKSGAAEILGPRDVTSREIRIEGDILEGGGGEKPQNVLTEFRTRLQGLRDAHGPLLASVTQESAKRGSGGRLSFKMVLTLPWPPAGGRPPDPKGDDEEEEDE